MKRLCVLILALVLSGAAHAQIGPFPIISPLPLPLTATAAGIALTFSGSQVIDASCTSPCTYDNSGAHYNIGAAAANRYVHVAVFTNTGGGATISSATICGVAATINKQQASTSGSVGGGIATANVPTGTTCDVVVTFATNPLRSGVGVWYSTGLSSATAASADSTNNCATCSRNVTPSAGGFVLAMIAGGYSSGPSWSGGVTQKFSGFYASSAGNFSGASADSLPASLITPQAGVYSAASVTFVAAAF